MSGASFFEKKSHLPLNALEGTPWSVSQNFPPGRLGGFAGGVGRGPRPSLSAPDNAVATCREDARHLEQQ